MEDNERDEEVITNADLKQVILKIDGTIIKFRKDFLDLKDEFIDFKNNEFRTLGEHVNHEVQLLSTKIDGKLDADELLTSLGFKLLNNRAFRWCLGVLAFTALASIASSEWFPLLTRLFEFWQRL